ncbi:MAG: hypothetical protein OSB36_04695, partial [Longimicrobiales bacterium]|nr:hypothetical protein [Longimicrobiales bacterium]
MLSKLVRAASLIVLTLLATTITARSLSAQTGTITGLVSSQSTTGPLQNVQVSIQELNVGSLSSGNGRYLLIAVPVGVHEVTVT